MLLPRRVSILSFPKYVEAIVNAPPANVQQLRSVLGLYIIIDNYYGKFIPNLSTLLHPLNALLCNSW